MSAQWQYQIRIDLDDRVSDLVRLDPENEAIKPLKEILSKHQAMMTCQLDAFTSYVAETEANGDKDDPLYRWTKATIEDPAKIEKYRKSFTLYVDGDAVYPKEKADALETDLQPLVSGGLVTRMSKHDTNPANNPHPPARYQRQASGKGTE